MSVDGYIAGPKGEFDWIVNDPSIDFSELFAQFDTFLLGRNTYELTLQPGNPGFPAGSQCICVLAHIAGPSSRCLGRSRGVPQ